MPRAHSEALLWRMIQASYPQGLLSQSQAQNGPYAGNNMALFSAGAAQSSLGGLSAQLARMYGPGQIIRVGPEPKEERRERRIKAVAKAKETRLRTKAEAELREYLGETLWTFPERVKKIEAMMDEVFAAGG